MKRVLYILLMMFGIGLSSMFAQQQVMFTQYMFNGLVLNPAYAGSHEAISVTALSRIQWVGIDGAPNTQTISIHSPVPDKNIGLGAYFVRDNIGVTKQNTFFFSYAYRMQMRRGKLALGLQGGFSNITVSYDDLGTLDSNLIGTENTFKPNFGVGVFYSTSMFYAGFSVPYIMSNRNENKNGSLATDIETEQIQHYFITTGAVFNLAPLVKLKPSILVKAVSGAPVQLDFNANVLFDEKLWFGVSYRSFDSIDILLEIQLNQQLKLGYAYDIIISDIRKVNTGSHEIMLNYRFVSTGRKIVTPRYF